MSYKISEETIKSLNDVFQMLNQLEIKGMSNVVMLAMVLQKFESIFQGIQDENPKPTLPENPIEEKMKTDKEKDLLK